MVKRPLRSLLNSGPGSVPRPLRDGALRALTGNGRILGRIGSLGRGPQDSPTGETPHFPLILPLCSLSGNEYEPYGTTDINAQTANGRLSVAINEEGTLTVFRHPRTTHYDQLKFRTTTPEAPNKGADPNAGAFIGLWIGDGSDRETVWLRDLGADQQYLRTFEDRYSDVVVTRFAADDFPYTVEVRDVVELERDVFHRQVELSKEDPDAPETVSLVAFENMNATYTKRLRHPARDWCNDYLNQDTATYDADTGAIFHSASGTDSSTGESVQTTVGMALGTDPDQFHVGYDGAEDALQAFLRAEDAYDAATRGDAPGNKQAKGYTNGVLAQSLDFNNGVARGRVLMAGGKAVDDLARTLQAAQDRTFSAVVAEKEEWLNSELSQAPMPATDNDQILELCKRALVTVRTLVDKQTGAIPASIATQSPYAEDWPRDGAYFNYILDTIGLTDIVERRNKWYMETQSDTVLSPSTSVSPSTPRGNWAMNLYADGTNSGPLPWEIDETGWVLWTMWDHYQVTDDEEYLREIYPAIKRGADFFVQWKDPRNNLHLPAIEDDNLPPKQTIFGAVAVWLGLDRAYQAAKELDKEQDRDRYKQRRDELAEAIDRELWNAEEQAYGVGLGQFTPTSNVGRPEVIWPAGFKNYDAKRLQKHAEAVYGKIGPTFDEPEAGERKSALYESKGLIALGKIWKDQPEKLELVREGVRWVADRHATDDTFVMGERWVREDGEIVSRVSQPHCWEQVLFYTAALEAFPPNGIGEADFAGTVERLRD